jgi:hypothetical protein
LFLLLALGLLAGCGDSGGGLSKEDREKAKESVEKALTAWKNGEPPTKWRAKNAPVRFVDEAWRKGQSLVEFEVVDIRANADGFPEVIVQLTIQTADGKKTESEALYNVNLTQPNQVSIGRDPMY